MTIAARLLSTAFLLLTMLFYLAATSKPKLRAGPYVASVACFTLGLLSKVSIVALPAFLLVLDLFPRDGVRRRPWKEAILSKIPFINRFFTNRLTSKSEKTLLILIRPEIIIQQENEDMLFPGLSDTLGGAASYQ